MSDPKMLKILKMELEHAQQAFDEAYADAYCQAPEVALRKFRITAKPSADMLKQIATQDKNVKLMRRALTEARREYVLAEVESQEQSNEIKISESISRVISATEADLDASPEALVAAINQVEQVSENIGTIRDWIDSSDDKNDSFWLDEVMENTTLYKSALTETKGLLRRWEQLQKDKDLVGEARSLQRYIKELQDDCRALSELARINIKGF